MAFFGLTQLGAQSTFNANLVSLQNYTCFGEEEFRAAFNKAAEGAETVGLAKVSATAPSAAVHPHRQARAPHRSPRSSRK